MEPVPPWNFENAYALRQIAACAKAPPPMSNGETNGKTNGHGVLSHEDPDLDDGAEHPREDEAAAEEMPPPPAVIAEAISACVRYVHAKYGVLMDGTSDTLSLLDQYVRDARAELAAKPTALDLLALSAGAYLGEVMRREMGGEWFSDGDPSGFKLYFSHVFLSFNPIGMVREALTGEEEVGWNAHLAADPAEQDEISARLAALPEVDDDEYRLPTTRFDVVSIVFEHLRAKAIAAGTADVRFGRDDY